jgi:methyl-accepting chemotaxis protein
MNKNEFEIGNWKSQFKNPIRSHPLRWGILLMLVVGISAAMGELRDQARLLLLVGVCLLPALAILRNLIHGRWLRPLDRLSHPSGVDETAKEGVHREALSSVSAFPRKVAWLDAVLWAVSAMVLLLALFSTDRLTSWQVLVVITVIIAGGTTQLSVCGISNASELAPMRRLLTQRLNQDPLDDVSAEIMNRRSMFLSMMFVVILMGLCSVFWLIQFRGQQVDSWAEAHRTSFQWMASEVDRVLLENDAGSRETNNEVFNQIPQIGESTAAIVLLGAKGQMLGRTLKAQKEPAWFKRMAELGATSWESLRTPFPFLARKVSGGRMLVLMGPSSINEAISSSWWMVAGMGLMAILAGMLSISITNRLNLSHRMLWSWLRQVSLGSGKPLPVDEREDELKTVVHIIRQMVKRVLDSMERGQEVSKDLRINQDHLQEQVRIFSEANEKRSQLVEQSATSMHEMKTSIQNISEQAESLRETSADCSSAMFEIERSIREVTVSSENLQKLIDDTVNSMSEITMSVDDISSNVEVLARTAEETVGSLSLMDNSIKQVEDNTNETKRISEEMSEIASKGAESVRQTISGINEIQQVTDEARAVINRLGYQIEAVGKILTVIGGVADQTNLLALNAAIIAAAAGEHGKGFAVVADEIKDLADRTSSSTKEIATLIKSVQAESRRAVDAIERGSVSVKRGVGLAYTAGQALQQILSSVHHSGEMTNSIAKSTSEHGVISKRITQSMGDISAMVREIRQAVGEQARNGSRIDHMSKQMREDARFVSRSAVEQVQAAGNVTRDMEKISQMVSIISKAIIEQTQGVGHVAKAVEEVRDAFQQDKLLIVDLTEISARVGRDVKVYMSNMAEAGAEMGGQHERG